MAKIMIVDDASFMRSVLKSILQDAGHEIICEASNGREAVEKYPAYHPDLVTMDITMPEMEGIEAVQKIMTKDPSAKIIMCSAMGQRHQVVNAIKSGAIDFIVKPFHGSRVLESVERALELQDGRGNNGSESSPDIIAGT